MIRRGELHFIIFILFCACTGSLSLAQVSPVSIEKIKSGFSLVPVNNNIKPLHLSGLSDRQRIFLDSIREKASRNLFTRKIYEMLIVSADTVKRDNKEKVSDESYRIYSGKRIRSIKVRRLNVFGADIDRPDLFQPDRTQSILNKTHRNTSERIIRKNLLFAEGDSLSPVSLSDNERILRNLSFIDDARIKVIPVSPDEVDIVVITKDIYSLGGDYSPTGLKSGSFSAFENNLFGQGHELGITVPYDNAFPDSPGFGFHYLVNNIASSFVNLDVFFKNGIGNKSYGFDLDRQFVSHSTKYAGGISIHNVTENVDLDILKKPEHYNLQDYWLARSFMLNHDDMLRLIIGGRYTNNNVFERPLIMPDSWYALQNYSLFLGSVALLSDRYSKSNLVHEYGRTEDIPIGGMLRVTMGRENNEFKNRMYAGSEVSFGYRFPMLGYIYSSAGLGAFVNQGSTEQGILSVKMKFFSNLVPIGKYMNRNFMSLEYTRGFDRNTDEHLKYFNDNGFSGFRNDSITGEQRMSVKLESVFFSPIYFYGFRFAFFAFADASSLAGTNQIFARGTTVTAIGLGIRVRNDNLIFHTFQIRIGYFPNPPVFSKINPAVFSGEEPLRLENFETGPPAMIPYR